MQQAQASSLAVSQSQGKPQRLLKSIRVRDNHDLLPARPSDFSVSVDGWLTTLGPTGDKLRPVQRKLYPGWPWTEKAAAHRRQPHTTEPILVALLLGQKRQ